MAKMSKKQQYIKALEVIGMYIPVTAEVKGAIDYTVDLYGENPRNVDLKDIKETVDMVENSTKKTFKQLLNDVKEMKEGSKEEEKQLVLVENSPKKTGKIKKSKKASEEVKEEKKEEPVVETSSTEEETENVEPVNFPKEFTSSILDGATLKRRDDIKDLKTLAELVNETEVDLVITTYWNKKQLKQFREGYDPLNINKKLPKSFEHDLDIVDLTYVHELVATGHSLNTIVPSTFLPQDFEQDEAGVRYSNGIEFQIYEVAKED